MELQQAKGKIVLTFTHSKCFIKFFAYGLISVISVFPLCTYLSIVFLIWPLAGLLLHSVLIIPWHYRFPQSQLGVNSSLSNWVGWLIDCETLDIWWLCVGMYHARECHGLGP